MKLIHLLSFSPSDEHHGKSEALHDDGLDPFGDAPPGGDADETADKALLAKVPIMAWFLPVDIGTASYSVMAPIAIFFILTDLL